MMPKIAADIMKDVEHIKTMRYLGFLKSFHFYMSYFNVSLYLHV